jgi:hypothetical protein
LDLEGAVPELCKLEVAEQIFYLSAFVTAFVNALEAFEEVQQEVEIADDMGVGAEDLPRV